MKPVETIPGMEEGDKRVMEGVNSAMIHWKNFCKYHKVPPQ
jgi:hypothetical protein